MLASPSDRNVLFGVLALQMEFIMQAGLIAAIRTAGVAGGGAGVAGQRCSFRFQ